MSDHIDTHDPVAPAPIEEIDALASQSTTPVSRGTAAATGLLSAGVALGMGELLSGVSNKFPSLIVRVGDVVIENAPGSVEKWAIDTLGTNDKPALVIGIALVSLLIGAATGIAASRKFPVGIVVFVLFGLLGGLAAASDPRRPGGWAWFSAILAATAGIATLHYLLTAAHRLWNATASFEQLAASRRGFLGAAAGAAERERSVLPRSPAGRNELGRVTGVLLWYIIVVYGGWCDWRSPANMSDGIKNPAVDRRVAPHANPSFLGTALTEAIASHSLVRSFARSPAGL